MNTRSCFTAALSLALVWGAENQAIAADACAFEPPVPPENAGPDFDWRPLAQTWCASLVDCGLLDPNAVGNWQVKNCEATYLSIVNNPPSYPPHVTGETVFAGTETTYTLTCRDSDQYLQGLIDCSPCDGGEDGGATEESDGGGEETGGGGYCGDWICDGADGEDCSSCELDCGCAYPTSCYDGECVEACLGRSCGPDPFLPHVDCGECDEEFECNDHGTCECTDVNTNPDCREPSSSCGQTRPAGCPGDLICSEDGNCVECESSDDCGGTPCCDGVCIEVGCC